MNPAVRELLLSSGSPAWIFAGSDIDFDFANNRYFQRGQSNSVDQLITVSRASTGYVQDSDGIWKSVGNNLPRIGRGNGLLVEEARTNRALWCRDMTNAAWVKVTMTAALTATGIDGTANSASTLTATGAAATVLQTVTLASSADAYGVFLKRVSGSGTVSITGDGISYTTVVPTSSWQLFQITATLINPVFGIKLATSGDVIAADFNQLEQGAFSTSPILVTTVAVTRAADVVTVTNPAAIGSAATLFASGTPLATVGGSGNHALLVVGDNANNNALQVVQRNNLQPAMVMIVAGVGTTTSLNASSFISSGKLAASFEAGAQSGSFNGAAPGTAAVASMPTSGNLPIIFVGSIGGAAQFADGTISRVALRSTTSLSNADLQRITA